MRSRSAISLFSGAGGMDVGFSKAGFHAVFANDIDQYACETYRNNIGDIHEGPLGSFFPVLSKLEGVDLLFGGPPCQGFSVAGKMDPTDERSRLIWNFFDAVQLVKPQAFVCENVKALAFLSRWQAVRDGLLQRGREMGYGCALLTLNAADFGVPQARERMFLVGVRGAECDAPDIKEALIKLLKKSHKKPPTVSDITHKLGRAGSATNPRACKAIVTYAKQPVLRKSPYAGMLFNGAGRPIRSSGVSCTLAASMGGNKTPIIDELEIFDGSQSFVEEYHSRLMDGGKPYNGYAPDRLRRLTVDECLAIQTFPRGYKLAGRQSSMYKQIGNAVPCKLAEAVGRAVSQLLDTY